MPYDAKDGCPRLLRPRDQWDSFHPRRCGKPLEEGQEICKMHRAADERAAARSAARTDARQADDQRRQDGQRRAEILARAGGLTTHAEPYWQPSFSAKPGRYTGGVVLSAELADALIRRLVLREEVSSE